MTDTKFWSRKWKQIQLFFLAKADFPLCHGVEAVWFLA